MFNKEYLDKDIVVYKNAINNSEDIINIVENILCKNYSESWIYSTENNIINNPFFINRLFYYIGQHFNISRDDYSKTFSIEDTDRANIRQSIKTSVDRQVLPMILDFIKENEVKINSRSPWIANKSFANQFCDFKNDKNQNNSPQLSFVISLNNEYIGGEILFKNRNGNETYKLQKNDLMIYPSEYEYKILPVDSGTQYLLTSFGL